MVYLAVDSDGEERIFSKQPIRELNGYWIDLDAETEEDERFLPEGTIFMIIERSLSWIDDPVEIKGGES